jgi:hypothetical protein
VSRHNSAFQQSILQYHFARKLADEKVSRLNSAFQNSQFYIPKTLQKQ